MLLGKLSRSEISPTESARLFTEKHSSTETTFPSDFKLSSWLLDTPNFVPPANSPVTIKYNALDMATVLSRKAEFNAADEPMALCSSCSPVENTAALDLAFRYGVKCQRYCQHAGVIQPL